MAAVLTQPEAVKAAGAAPDMVHLTFPIEKRQDTDTVNPLDGTPDLLIWGKASDGTLDSDLQIVDPDWSLKALREWFDTKANVRMQHDPKQPVGKGLDIDGHYVKSLICDPKAKYFIRQGVLNDYSIGIMNPEVRKVGDPRFRHLDPQGKAIGGIVTGRPDGSSKIGELTVCDRGANYGASFAIAKAATDGSLVLVDELTAPDDVLAKYAAPTLTKANGKPKVTSVDLPSDMKLTVTPATLAKLATLKRELVLQEQATKQAAADFVAKAAGPDAVKRDFDPNVGEHGTDRDTMPESDFAGRNRSFPIHDASDVSDALQSIGRAGPDNYSAAKLRRNIVRIAGSKGFPVPASAAKPKKKTAKTAAPDVTKCGTCDGSEMVDGKPCPDCKGKAAAPATGKKKGKMRALCPNCGAKQNPAHAHCPECGKPLPPGAVQVKKNHDFVCLGCGHELDKGEPHCPGCGKPNPGYLPEADRKIPGNQDADKSAGKDRVAKARKKSGKKGKPFGGSQAKPFGTEDDKEPAGKPDKAKAEKRRKGKSGKRYGRDPAAGVKGHETAGLPPHREPDGAPVERFEDDAHLQDGDQQMKTALRHKGLGVEPHLAVLHDLTCPAFAAADVEKAIPHASFAAIDTQYWATKALEAASGADIATAMQQYNALQALSKAAVTLKTAERASLDRIRAAAHEAFLHANQDLIKTFTDATPGPGSAPTPAHVMPGSFRRPYISAGHAAASPQAEGARTFPVITDHPQAQDFHRGYLSGGHAAESPDNTGRSEPMPAGSAGMPESAAAGAAGMQARDYEHAVSAMHDHLSRIAPGMCPMSPPMGATQKPAPHVPEPAGMIEPHGAKTSKADKAAARAARKARAAKKAARAAAQKAKARKRSARKEAALKAAAPAIAPILPVPPDAPPPVLDAEAVTAAVKAAQAPLLKRIERQDKALRKNKKVLNAIAAQPDTSQAPFRGAGVYKQASAAPAAPQTAAEAAALAQTGHIQRLHHDWRNSHIPEVREAAYKELTAQLGLTPMTQTQTPMNPFTT